MTLDPDEYASRDGMELARLLRAGEISPLELMRCAVEMAERIDPALNALCFTDHEAALRHAGEAAMRGTFGAMPFLLKDSGLASTLLRSSIGSRLFDGMTSSVDATLVQRFRDDGFIPFGRTTVPEFCMAPTTEALRNGGPTRNPWDPSRSSGGSSGGAAVAVATGIVPIAHGSDGGGSIRIPAACCGVYGLKPSRGLTPHGPLRGEGWGGLAVDGVLSRTVRDTAAALDGVAGYEPGAPYASPSGPGSYLSRLTSGFDRPMRIARWTQAWNDIAIAPECLDAIAEVSELLTQCGHEVVDSPPPPLKYDAFIDAVIEVMAANVALAVNGYLRRTKVEDWRTRLEPAILDACDIGTRLSAETYALAINRFHSIGRDMESCMRGVDCVLTPTLTQLPAKLGVLSMEDDFRTFRRKAGRYTTFLAIVNASGQPAASLPIHWTSGGLPVGVQLIGHFGREDELLRLSAQLEQASGWQDRRPRYAPEQPAAPRSVGKTR